MESARPERGNPLNHAARGIFALVLTALAPASYANEPADCKFTGLDLPADFAVLAGGEYSGRPLDFQIDQSGHQATQMDVVVNYTAKPVVLILGAYEPTIWNIQWSHRTRILAVLTGGYHRQAVAGLPKSLPLRVRSYEDGKPCGYFYVGGGDLNSISRSMFGRAVDAVYLAKNGAIVAGDPLPTDEPLETSRDTTPESFIDGNAPLAGPAGLRDAVAKGLLRPATKRDAEVWEAAVAASRSSPDKPSVPGQTKPRVEHPMLFNAYVVLKPFTFPAGLYGGNSGTFFVPKGVLRPQGNPGHSTVYDFNTILCHGASCGGGPVALLPATTARSADAAKKNNACSSSDSDSACLAEELRRSDDEINSVYKKIMGGLDAGGRKNLRSQQREWLKSRNTTCSLSSRLSDRSDWIDYVLADNARAVCVVRLTKERLAQLADLDKKSMSAAAGEKPLAMETRTKPQRSNSDYATSSRASRSNGKWYFEVQVDHGKVASTLEATLFIGVGADETSVGTLYHIRPQDVVLDFGAGDSITIVGGNIQDFTFEGGGLDGNISLPAATVGIAVDLDSGKLYVRQAGQWRPGLPGSAQGQDVKLGRNYKASIQSSVPLTDLIRQGAVSVNFGNKPFVEPVPDGYAVFDASPSPNAVSGGAVRLASVEVVPHESNVAAQPPAHWIQKYFAWLRAVPADAKPTVDASGARCAERQSGPVWFLAGSESTAPVVRTCEIPAGVHVLISIVNVLAQPNPGTNLQCKDLLQSLKEYGFQVTDLRLTVDGVALQNPTSYRTGSGCFELNDVSQGQNGPAAGSGYWVFLKPLPPGRHEIAFGGTYIADGFTQDIKYLINVR